MAKKRAAAEVTPEASEPAGETEIGNGRGAKGTAVKAYLAEHPEAKAKEIIAALAGQGLKITPNYISVIRGGLKTSKPKGKPGRKPRSGHESHGFAGSSKGDAFNNGKAAEATGGPKPDLKFMTILLELGSHANPKVRESSKALFVELLAKAFERVVG